MKAVSFPVHFPRCNLKTMDELTHAMMASKAAEAALAKLPPAPFVEPRYPKPQVGGWKMGWNWKGVYTWRIILVDVSG